jgi:hypothetical protein
MPKTPKMQEQSNTRGGTWRGAAYSMTLESCNCQSRGMIAQWQFLELSMDGEATFPKQQAKCYIGQRRPDTGQSDLTLTPHSPSGSSSLRLGWNTGSVFSTVFWDFIKPHVMQIAC